MNSPSARPSVLNLMSNDLTPISGCGPSLASMSEEDTDTSPVAVAVGIALASIGRVSRLVSRGCRNRFLVTVLCDVERADQIVAAIDGRHVQLRATLVGRHIRAAD